MPESESKVISKPRTPFRDERGEILNLVDEPFASAAQITSKPGAIRANHFHKTDYHYCWIQKGRMLYYHRPAGSSGEPQRWEISAGQIVYTPPMYEHAMLFLEETVMFVFARNSRHMENYEADTVRIGSIIPKTDER